MKNYNPKKVSLIIGEKAFSGYAEDTFIELGFKNDAFSMKVGADGQVTRVGSADNTGFLNVTLDQASDCNDFLSLLTNVDRETGLGVKPVLVRDANGTTLATGAHAWVRKQPDTTFSKKSEDRKWELDIAELIMHTGGNADQA